MFISKRGLLLLLLMTGATPTKAQRPRVAVAVSIVSDNEFTEQARSVLTRELRRFPEVSVVSDGQLRDFVVSVGALPLRVRGSYQLSGISLSYVLVSQKSFVHRTFVVGVNELSTSLEGLVAEFDTTFLEPRRHSRAPVRR